MDPPYDVAEPPTTWDLDEIAKETPPYGVDGRLDVLAWKVEEDDRPLRLESCLVLNVLDGDYCLAHLVRRPTDAVPSWRLSQIHVSGEPGTKYFPGLDIMHCKRFKKRPTSDEIYAALGMEDVYWSFEESEHTRLLQCGVCATSWREAIGEPPTRFFTYRRRGLFETLRIHQWFGR